MTARRSCCVVAALVVALLTGPSLSNHASALVPDLVRSADSPQLNAPPSGVRGHPYLASLVDLSAHGYVEEELLVSGTARAADGTTAPYTTRVVVRRPAHAGTFNGTALVEWFNVTPQVDIDLDWAVGYRHLLRERFAYVGVSAQQAGVRSLQLWDPVRYGSLSHPGADYSFDIFTQVVSAVRAGEPLMADLAVERVLASGHSQSGGRLHTYVEEFQANAGVIDGFLIRGDSRRTFELAELPVPVLHYMSESETVGLLTPGSGEFRPDGGNYRLWQIAGAAHNDMWSNAHWLLTQMPRDWAALPVTWDPATHGRYGAEPGPGPCDTRLSRTNEFPQRYSFAAALHHLDRWVRGGAEPPSMPRLELDSNGQLVRDEHGNARGGIRYPVVDVPVATYSGEGGCPLTGWTLPLDDATLAELYPTHGDYLAALETTALEAVEAELLLPDDFDDLMTRASEAPVPRR